MKNRLPVDIEKLDMPEERSTNNNIKRDSYGYASIFYILGVIITGISVIICIKLR